MSCQQHAIFSVHPCCDPPAHAFLFTIDKSVLPSIASTFVFIACLRDHVDLAEKRMRQFELRADTMLGEMKEIFSRLDFIAAVTSRCLLVSVEGDNPCPRLIRVDEDLTSTRTPSKLSHYRRKTMDSLRRKLGKPKAHIAKPRRYRVRFLCAHDMSAGVCGPDGEGYIVKSEENWQRWLRKCLPLVQVSGGKQLITIMCA